DRPRSLEVAEIERRQRRGGRPPVVRIVRVRLLSGRLLRVRSQRQQHEEQECRERFHGPLVKKRGPSLSAAALRVLTFAVRYCCCCCVFVVFVMSRPL